MSEPRLFRSFDRVESELNQLKTETEKRLTQNQEIYNAGVEQISAFSDTGKEIHSRNISLLSNIEETLRVIEFAKDFRRKIELYELSRFEQRQEEIIRGLKQVKKNQMKMREEIIAEYAAYSRQQMSNFRDEHNALIRESIGRLRTKAQAWKEANAPCECCTRTCGKKTNAKDDETNSDKTEGSK